MIARAFKILLEDACARMAEISQSHAQEDYNKIARELALFLHNAVPCGAVDVLIRKVGTCMGMEDIEQFYHDVQSAIDEIGDGNV